MALHSKKENRCWVWLAVDHDTRRIEAVRVEHRDRKTLKGLLMHILTPPNIYATDSLKAYRYLDHRYLRCESKALTTTAENTNGRLRHFLARFRCKTKCFSKNLRPVIDAINLFQAKNLGYV